MRGQIAAGKSGGARSHLEEMITLGTHKFGVKFFITNPEARPLRDFIPVFHGWIQRQALPGHLLIDVHDYSHVHHGPGILLVAHEANISLDQAEGRPGLLYLRKRTPVGLPEIVTAARQAARLLAEEQGVQFDPTGFELVCNDRLVDPRAEELSAILQASVQRRSADPRARPTFWVVSP